jgi:hypothetical protein
MNIKFSLFLMIVIGFLVFPTISLAATPSIATSESTANVAAGTDDQAAATAATVANVEEVKATRTLTVGTLPVDAETIVIGTCTVTFATTTAGSPAEDANCTGGATILTTTGTADDIARTAGEIAAALRTLTNVSDTGHGALTVTGSGSDAIFTTTGTEASATAITFTDGTTGDVTSTASTVGVIPVAQVNTITITGTVDEDDVFTATLPTVGAVDYTVLSSDTTTSDIAAGLDAAIQASSGYASQDFTSADSTNTVVLTAKVAGTGFTQTSSAANRSATAQVVVFTPANVSDSYTYALTINSTSYVYEPASGDGVKQIVEGLQPLVDAASAVSCTENDAAVTCTAASAGTSFTYSAKVSPAGGGSSGGSYFFNPVNLIQNQTPAAQLANLLQQLNSLQAQLANLRAQTVQFTRGLHRGLTGDDVRQLQERLARDSEIYPENLVTGYFGPLTETAVQRFQLKHGIVTADNAGYGWFGPRTTAKLLELLGE